MKAEEKAQELYPNNSTFCGGVAQIARDAFIKGARLQKEVDDKELSEKVSAAYQLGLSDREKPMQEGLDEEINQTYHDGSVTDTSDLDHNSYENIARHFAQWQKDKDTRDMCMSDNRHFQKVYELGRKDMREQMMKEVVEAIVEDWNPDPEPEITIPLNPEEFTCGDKVRIIIIKEEKNGTE